MTGHYYKQILQSRCVRQYRRIFSNYNLTNKYCYMNVIRHFKYVLSDPSIKCCNTTEAAHRAFLSPLNRPLRAFPSFGFCLLDSHSGRTVKPWLKHGRMGSVKR